MCVCAIVCHGVCNRYLEENVGAMGVKLSTEEMQELESIVPVDQVRV